MQLLFKRDILIANKYTNTTKTYQSTKKKINEIEEQRQDLR